MPMVNAPTARAAGGPTFHDARGKSGRTVGPKQTILVDILGLPFASRVVDAARAHDVTSASLLLADELSATLRDAPAKGTEPRSRAAPRRLELCWSWWGNTRRHARSRLGSRSGFTIAASQPPAPSADRLMCS